MAANSRRNQDNQERRTDINGRMLPHNIEAEQSILCCALIDNDAAMYMVEHLTHDCFYSESHQHIFDAMYYVKNSGAKIDVVTLVNQLESVNLLSSVGSVGYINTLSNIVPDSANYRSYVEIIRNKYLLRRLVSTCSKTIEGAFNNLDSELLLSDTELSIRAIAEKQERGSLVPINRVLGDVMQRIKDLEDPNNRLGIPTGFTGINEITNGLQRSDLVLIAARPSVGKTAFGMNLIANIATAGECFDREKKQTRRYSCAVFSLEMTKEQLTQRMLCSTAGVSMSRVNKGKLSVEEWKKLKKAREVLAQSQIYVDDTALIKPVQIMEKCIRLKNQHGLDCILIDYLQLLTSDDTRVENRQTEISQITRFLKILAKEINVPILLLSQLSRKVESRVDKTPMLSDLRESGAIEQDADIVMFIHRDLAKEIDEPTDKVDIIFAKHRNGKLGRVTLKWDGEFVRFSDDPSSGAVSSADSYSAPPAVRQNVVLGMDEKEDNGIAASFHTAYNPDGSPAQIEDDESAIEDDTAAAEDAF